MKTGLTITRSGRLRNLFVCALAAIAIIVTSCRPGSPTGSGSSTKGNIRIVSLSPAISRALVDLNLHHLIVGRTPYCDSLDQAIPAVGDLLNLNYEHLIRLQPTHVLVQPPESGLNEKLSGLAKQHNWTVGVWQLNTIDDIEKMVRDLPGTLFQDGTEQLAQAGARAAELTAQMATALSPGEDALYQGRTLLVYSVSPVSVFGANTYLDDVLRSLGGKNAIDAEGWVSISLEDLVRLNPSAIVFIKPNATTGVWTTSGPIWELEIDAVMNRRMAVLKHPDAFLPSSSVISVAGELRGILADFEELGP